MTDSDGTASALIRVAPPEKFNFNQPASWHQWYKRFERYLAVSGLSSKTDKEKIDILLYIMGEESEEVLIQFPIVPATFTQMVKRFEDYFIPRRNVIFERFQFNSRVQKPGESADSFITSLHHLAEHCEFSVLKESLIRDRIVVGMLDKKTSERLQLQATLTLAEAVIAAKQAELQAQQSAIIRQETLSGQVNAVLSKKKFSQDKHWSSKKKKVPEICSYCGLQFHIREKCPAKNSKCRSCQKKGHWDKVCHSKTTAIQKTVKNVNVEECNETNELFLGQIKLNNQNQWTVDIAVKELQITTPFLVDTGADVICIPQRILPQEFSNKCSPCNEIISGPVGKGINVLGKIQLTLEYCHKVCCMSVFIIKDLTLPILGRPGILKLDIINFSNNNLELAKADFINSVVVSHSKINILHEYPDVFKEIGVFKDEISIKLKEDAKPFVQASPRVVPIPLLPKLKYQLDKLLKLNIIESVEVHTDWVAPIVVVPKGDTVRICGDYTKLNNYVLRSHYPLPKVETSLSQLKGSKYFSKLDANSGFYQIRLDKESQRLTTFITPFGRFMFKRLPFGISCAPEYFSLKFSRLFSEITGVLIHVDDLLIHARTIEEHDKILKRVLTRLQEEGITLNASKCAIGVQKVTFLGHIVSTKGVEVDPRRVEAITKYPDPTCKREVQQLLGMINFASRYILNKSEILEPISSLLKNDVSFIWDKPQKEAFRKIKQQLTEAPCLAFFDPSKNVIVSADASSYGIGCALMQEADGIKQLVAYGSRTLTSTESRYAQIEKESLALTWACERFQEYVVGIPITLETDHKPLIQVLQTKNLDSLTPRLQRFRMRLMRYDYRILYTPGDKLVVADALSRNPLNDKPVSDELSSETEAYVKLIVKTLPVKNQFLQKIISEQSADSVCQILKEYTLSGWPEKAKLSVELIPYYQYRDDISFVENLLLKDSRIIIPNSLQLEVLNFIHMGHLGIVKCRERAKVSVWWIGLSTQLANLIRSCPNCVEERSNTKEPFIKDTPPVRPWQIVATDLFKYKIWYLIVTDYYSRFFEIVPLTRLTELDVIAEMKTIFARHGIPDVVRSDNGPQFQRAFKNFANEYQFKHITSSPYYPQSNGAVEAAVKVAKNLLKKNSDINLALLSYRSTPLECGFSPAELLFSRKVKSLVPMLESQLEKIVDARKTFSAIEGKRKEKQRKNYNVRHRVKELSKLQIGDSVWVIDLRVYGKIIEKGEEPRSYLVQTSRGSLCRRNRWMLVPASYYTDRYMSHNEIVPSLISDDSNNSKKSESAQSVNNQDIAASPPRRVTETESVLEQNCEEERSTDVKQKRERKKPIWMKDYVTS